MAFAKPGPQKKPAATPKTTFQAPPTPEGMTPGQAAAWAEITSNPYLQTADTSLLHQYMRMVAMSETAFKELQGGLLIEDARGSMKTNPAYKIWRDCEERILRLRDVLLMTPKARVQLPAAPPTEDLEDDIEDLAD